MGGKSPCHPPISHSLASLRNESVEWRGFSFCSLVRSKSFLSWITPRGELEEGMLFFELLGLFCKGGVVRGHELVCAGLWVVVMQ